MTNKETGEQGGGAGRLIIGYRRDENGDWKMALDDRNKRGKDCPRQSASEVVESAFFEFTSQPFFSLIFPLN